MEPCLRPDPIGSYKNFKPLCGSALGRTYTNRGPHYKEETLYSPFTLFADTHPIEASLILKQANFKAVRPLFDNVMHTVLKSDIPPKDPSGELFNKALHDVKSFFCFLEAGFNTSEFQIKPDTSPGQPYLKAGFRKKKAVLSSDKGVEMLVKHVVATDHVPICSTNDKLERLSEEEFYRADQAGTSKVRMIYVPPFDFLIKQKILYDNQNIAIIDNCFNHWIKYGMSKEYGGFHRLITALERFDRIEMSDISGFDRSAYLRVVYEIRNHYLKTNDPFLLRLISYVAKYIVNPVVILPNGDIVQMQTGNISGQNNTSADNSILHFLVLIYLFYKMLNRISEPLTLIRVFNNAEYAIYSDDKLGGYDNSFFQIEKEEYTLLMIATYQEFGLNLKPKAVLIRDKEPGSTVPQEFEFLGSRCGYLPKACRYVPLPRLGQICTSIAYGSVEGKSISMRCHFNRLVSLYILAINTHIEKPILEFLKFFYSCPSHWKYRAEFDDVLDSVNGVDLNFDCDFHISGLESGGFQIFPSDLIPGFSSDYWRMVGFKSL